MQLKPNRIQQTILMMARSLTMPTTAPPLWFPAVPVTTTNNIDAMTAARKNLFVTPDHLSSSGQTLPSGQFPAV